MQLQKTLRTAVLNRVLEEEQRRRSRGHKKWHLSPLQTSPIPPTYNFSEKVKGELQWLSILFLSCFSNIIYQQHPASSSLSQFPAFAKQLLLVVQQPGQGLTAHDPAIWLKLLGCETTWQSFVHCLEFPRRSSLNKSCPLVKQCSNKIQIKQNFYHIMAKLSRNILIFHRPLYRFSSRVKIKQ